MLQPMGLKRVGHNLATVTEQQILDLLGAELAAVGEDGTPPESPKPKPQTGFLWINFPWFLFATLHNDC